MTKKEKFFNNLIKLINVEGDVDEIFLQDTQKLIAEFIDVYVKPKIKGIELCKIVYDENAIAKNEDAKFIPLGKGVIHIYTGKLKLIESRKERNIKLASLVFAASHEIRHYLQYLYAEEEAAFGDSRDDEKIAKLEKLLGKKSGQFADYFQNQDEISRYAYIHLIKNFLVALDKIDFLQAEFGLRESSKRVSYLLKPIEIDARKTSRRMNLQVIDEFNGYVKKLYPTVNFPKKFEAVVDLAEKITPKKIADKQDAFDLLRSVDSPRRKKMNTKKLQQELARIDKGILERKEIEEFVGQLEKAGDDEKLQQTREVFEALVLSAKHHLAWENQTAALDKFTKKLFAKMKTIKIEDFAYYVYLECGDETEDPDIDKLENVFYECLTYAKNEFWNEDNLVKLENILKQQKNTPDEVVEIVSGVRKRLFPFQDEFFTEIKEGKATVQGFIEFAERIDKKGGYGRGRAIGKALERCWEQCSDEFTCEKMTKALDYFFAKGGLTIWVAFQLREAMTRHFPGFSYSRFELE